MAQRPIAAATVVTILGIRTQLVSFFEGCLPIMTEPLVTVAIPTRNRCELLRRAMRSALNQTFQHFELIVIDNASTDQTRAVVDEFGDDRLRYYKNQSDLGIIGNWNRATELSRATYLNIFHDDDVMHPEFLERSVQALESCPTVGFTFPLVRRVTVDGQLLSMWCERALYPNAGVISGISYVLTTIERGRCMSIAPSMVFRKSVHATVGSYAQVYGFNTFDMNMWLQIAFAFDTYLIDDVLFDYTIHADQMSERHWRTPQSPSGPIGMAIEIYDAAARLMRHPAARDQATRDAIAGAILALNKRLARDLATVIPDL